MPNDPLLDKVPPHSLEAEMSVLGAMMLSPEAIGLCVQYLDADSFYRQEHRALFQVLADLYEANKPLDLVIVREALRTAGEYEKVGGDEYLVTLADSVPTLANAEYYAKVVKEKALLRGLINAAAEIIRDAHAQDGSVDDVLDRCEQRIFQIAERKIVGQAYDVRSILVQVMKTLDFQSGIAVTGAPTGLRDLDLLTRGLQPGELIVLAARPSVGKSALALNIAEYVAADTDQAVAFFSLEMSKEELALRLLSSRARLDGQRMRQGMLTETELKKLQEVADFLYKVPIYVDDSPALRIIDLRAKARRLVMRHNVKLIIVDYLQLMSSPGAESRQVEVANISRGLKALARELRLPVLAVAQLRRPPPNQPREAPQISDLRESGAIEQDADVVLLLDRAATRETPGSEKWREAQGKAELIIGKQRNGPTGLVHLTWLWTYTRFESAARDADEPVPHEPVDAEPPPPRRAAPVQHQLEQIGAGPPPDADEEPPEDPEPPAPF
jgi:replicative DNA helicase